MRYLVLILFLAGCGLSPEEKAERWCAENHPTLTGLPRLGCIEHRARIEALKVLSEPSLVDDMRRVREGNPIPPPVVCTTNANVTTCR